MWIIILWITALCRLRGRYWRFGKIIYSCPYSCISTRIWRPSVSPKYYLHVLRIRIYGVVRNPNQHTPNVHRHKYI